MEEGDRREALSLARQALTLCERSGGLPVSGPFALCRRWPSPRRTPRRRGPRWPGARCCWRGGCPCHNHFELREVGIRLALRAGAWDEARRHAAALEQHLGDERTARGALVIEGARLLADGARTQRGAASERLGRLRAQAERAGLRPLARWLAGEPSTFTPH